MDPKRRSVDAHSQWQRVSRIARHAHGENDDQGQSSSSDDEKTYHNPVGKAVKAHHRRQERKEKEAWKGKMMVSGLTNDSRNIKL